MRIDINRILVAVEQSWADLEDLIDEANTEAIESETYGWTNPTRRSNGTIVTTPRDIVDTGKLRDSQSINRLGDTYHLDWDVDYAADVHEGTANKPARKWTQTAICGDETADPDYQNPSAILNVPAAFTDRFTANLQR